MSNFIKSHEHDDDLEERKEVLLLKESEVQSSPENAILYVVDEQGNTPLHRAIMAGNYDDVRELLAQKKVDVNFTNLAGQTPLMLSIFNSHGDCYPKMGIWLLEAGAEYQSSSQDREILEQLVRKEAWKLAYTLVDKGLKINQVDGSGRTLLHKASNENEISTVKQLIGLGANINASDDQAITPLHLAALKGNHQIINILIRNHALPTLKDQQGRTPLHIAIQKGNLGVCRSLIETGMGLEERNTDSKTALTMILEAGLQNAFDHVSCELLLLLLRKDVKLQTSIRNRSFDILSGVLRVNQLELFEELVRAGLNINAENSSGENLLGVIVKRQPDKPAPDSVNLVEKMVLLGGLVTHKDCKGNSLLHLVQNNRDAQTLIQKGLKVDDANHEGLTPLFVAAQNQKRGVCKALLAKKPSLYQPEKQKNVMHAAKANGKHTHFSRWLKSKITLLPSYLLEIENLFCKVFCRAKEEAELSKRNLVILCGEHHGEYHIYQMEVALMKAAERVGVPNLFIELPAKWISKGTTNYMPLDYANRHTNLNVIGVDKNRPTKSNSIDLQKSSLIFRDLGMSQSIEEAMGHGIGIVGAAHLEGLIVEPSTNLDLQKTLIVPINLSRIDSSSIPSFSFYEDKRNVIQINPQGYDENGVYDVIQKWNGVDLRLTHPRPRNL